MMSAITPASDADLQVLEEQLGRVPRGVVGIAARCACGKPTVVATAPRLEDGTHDFLPDQPRRRPCVLDLGSNQGDGGI